MKNSPQCLLVLLVLLMSIILVACGNSSSDIVKSDDNIAKTEENEKENTQDTGKLDKDTCFAEMLPDHTEFFKNGEVMVIDSDGGNMYCISIKHIKEEEYIAYKTACANGTFSIVTFDGETLFEARNQNEQYYVSLQYWIESENDDSQNSINITCGVVKNK